MPTRIAVDVGGTFTDLVLSDEDTGRIVIGKVPTVPDAPDEGVLGVLDSVLAGGDIASSEYFLHGTTVGLNALLENRGRWSACCARAASATSSRCAGATVAILMTCSGTHRRRW